MLVDYTYIISKFYSFSFYLYFQGLEVQTGDLGGWAAEQQAEQGCLTMAGVIGHIWVTMDCDLDRCCGDMNIDTLCRVY